MTAWLRQTFFDPQTRISWRRPAMGLGFVVLATWLLRDGTLTAADWVQVMQWVVPAFLLAEGLPAGARALSEASAKSTGKRLPPQDPLPQVGPAAGGG